ncbi:phosphoglycerate dehydrogenase [Halobacteriovorax marinus]|uniref:phosphoglycerate dehydrogenase n=1 Tax=Halobacteriovorax marinus TaxID=97084 RepID=UPI003A915CEA
MKVAVASRSFSKNAFLKSELEKKYQDIKYNHKGLKLAGDELVDFLYDANAVIIGLEVLDKDILNKLPNLKTISKYGVGLDNIDLQEVKRRNINLGWSAGVNKRSVSELTLSFALLSLRNTFKANSLAMTNQWMQLPGKQLSDKTFGILGLGNIGQDLAKLLSPFNCTILANDIDDRSSFAREYNIELVSKERLFKESDIVSLHIPYSENTSHLVDESLLSLMNQESVLINTSRGGIVNEEHLEKALKEKLISAAAFDVLSEEPPVDNPLLSLDNFFITPHIGGSSIEAIRAMGLAAIEGLSRKENS